MNKMSKILVAMSGGVDSSVAAALLKEKGFEVIGITLQLIPLEMQNFGECCSLSSIEDARKVAKILDIPHYVLNLREIFKKKVMNNFYTEYISGWTPNPCVRCNQYIKFDALWQKVKELKCEYLATGHYAKIEYDGKRNKYLLKKGKDTHKDQSYVLYVLTQQSLGRTLLPLDNYTKLEVRNMAKKLKLPVANKKDSQDICFVENKNYSGFLEKYFKYIPKEGNIINSQGEVLGKHKGIVNYTIGQRRGLGISSKRPLYVVDINSDNNEIIAGFEEDVYLEYLLARDINLISIDKISKPLKIKAKIRYKAHEAEATILEVDHGISVKFNKPQWAITPGQSVVFYDNDEVLGGGIIDRIK
ncbi:MAG: tRNA 2-thiouridine(34) synthase MnmA [Candidatus Firestonebacteria bacterium]